MQVVDRISFLPTFRLLPTRYSVIETTGEGAGLERCKHVAAIGKRAKIFVATTTSCCHGAFVFLFYIIGLPGELGLLHTHSGPHSNALSMFCDLKFGMITSRPSGDTSQNVIDGISVCQIQRREFELLALNGLAVSKRPDGAQAALNLYPTPGTVMMYCGFSTSDSIFLRNR